MPRVAGRQIFANPGPTNVPDRILRAIDRASIDFMAPEFTAVYDAAYDGLRRLIGTEGRLFMYTASGHGAWDATLLNLFSAGDVLLVPENGFFAQAWARMAQSHGLETRMVAADWRRGPETAEVRAALAADMARAGGPAIRALCAVHSDTATGLTLDIPAMRAALDETGHPALLLVDTISSLGSLEFRMDEWGVDGVVGGSQKGLMLPVGFSFTAVSEKAFAAHERAGLAGGYFDWKRMTGSRHRSFVGTIPAQLFYGLAESLAIFEEEGLDVVVARHARLAEGVRQAVRAWSGNEGPELYCQRPDRASNSVTSIMMPEGHDAEAVRRIAREKYNVSLGGGLGPLDRKVFRIGHLGDLNEAMVLGVLGAVELSLGAAGVPHGRGGVAAAMAQFAGA